MVEDKKSEVKSERINPLLGKVAKVINSGVGAKRRIVIETDGSNVHIAEMTVSNLEACEIFTRIIKKFRSD